jgi:S-formylglutathione hydrolase FrmB
MRRATRCLALGACLAVAVCGAASAAPVATDGRSTVRLVGEQRLDPRLQQLTFTTPALAGQVQVRVLMPTGYDASRERYPVLYLLHGSTGSAAQWTTDGFAAESLTAGLPLIVVMPDGGPNGEYTNWVAPPSGSGPEQWETFHMGELVPWIDAHFRTIRNRDDRALSGESMGGLGTMEYAARFPDLFGMAASLSGAVSLVSWEGLAGVLANEEGFGSAGPNAIYGSFASDQVNFRGHSPPDLAMNLAATRLWISAYDGLPTGPYGPGADEGGYANILESGVHEDSEELLAALTRLGIPVAWHDLGAGVHETPEFNHELSLALPSIMAAFARPASTPASVSYTSTAPTWTQWGWTVAMHRQVTEFSTLLDASARHFELLGSGSATVNTPANYRPGASYRITLTRSQSGEPGASGAELGCGNPTGEATLNTSVCEDDAAVAPYETQAPPTAGASSTLTLRARADRRLLIPVPLGTSNTEQEFSDGTNAGTLIYRTTVVIVAAPRHQAARPRSPKRRARRRRRSIRRMDARSLRVANPRS